MVKSKVVTIRNRIKSNATTVYFNRFLASRVKGGNSFVGNGTKTPLMYHKSGVSITILFIYKRSKLHLLTNASNRNPSEGTYLWIETNFFRVKPSFYKPISS